MGRNTQLRYQRLFGAPRGAGRYGLATRVHSISKDTAIRYTVTIDDALYERAQQMAEPGLSKSDLFREAFLAYVRVKTAQRLHALGGTDTDPHTGTVAPPKTNHDPGST